jgi:hypothetical protein
MMGDVRHFVSTDNSRIEMVISVGIVEMEIEIPIDSSLTLTDLQTGRYNIYATDSKEDLLSGKYRYIVEASDIISIADNKVRYRTEESTVFGVGRISECVDCEPCVDCDQKPETLCFVGAIGNSEVTNKK